MSHLTMTSSRPPPAHGSGCSRFVLWIILLFIFFFISASALLGTSSAIYHSTAATAPCGIIRCFLTAEPASALASQESSSDMKIKGKPTKPINQEEEQERDSVTATTARARPRRRSMTGPGSSPPRCASKCGRCKPCKPVHVAVPPGTPVTAEYYPEAWRCKCGNRLFIP